MLAVNNDVDRRADTYISRVYVMAQAKSTKPLAKQFVQEKSAALTLDEVEQKLEKLCTAVTALRCIVAESPTARRSCTLASRWVRIVSNVSLTKLRWIASISSRVT
jgi:hypothetical protein